MMNLTQMSPLQLTIASLAILFAAAVWFYIIARLASWGVAKSWYDFKNKYGRRGRNKQKEGK